MIGKEYGSRIELSKGWAYVLQPNPELWTLTLPHRTQIIYTPDISMILFQLEVKPGSVVIEAGTGSGSLSHYFLRAIKPNGHLHTFDFHEARVEQAREEFKKHGLEDFVTVRHRDVCQDGFSDELNGLADAVFLDLPAPYLAIESVTKAIKPSGGRFCSFSPCIEQVQATCEQLSKFGFDEIQTLEVLQSETIVKSKQIPVIDLEFVKTKKDAELNSNEPKDKDHKKSVQMLVSSNLQNIQGHTGFLTFATLLNR